MWCFSLDKFFWFDKVCFLNVNKKIKLSPWDLIKDGDSFFIILGEKIEYKSLYEKFIWNTKNIEKFEKNFLSEKTIKLIHRMVKTRFTSYKKVFNLFLPTFEIEKLFKYKQNKTKKSVSQKLFVFPDLWTAFNIIWNLEKIYSSHNTTIQKIKLFRWIKNWKIEEIYCTWSVIFQDWLNLKKIIIYYPHKRYYKNQQDPRYNVFEVVKKMKKIYECEIECVKDFNI